MVSVCYTHWFDSGYMFGAVYEAFWKNFSLFSCWAVGDDFRLSPYSALSLVRQRIHALRQSTELVVCSHIPM